QDIASAHVLALEYLEKTGQSDAFNLGSGSGFSVKQMVDAVEKICKTKLKIKYEKRRAGDPAILLANPTKIQKTLGWKPTHSSLTTILQSALTWENRDSLREDPSPHNSHCNERRYEQEV
ncbi:GDP-mannose 4,6-dehydratase, partial [Candidatus Babeliales bacterium]|nr:GDP-mannose 4,6-dehydratase [Candidatus Babeliales bacterium]